MSIRARSLVAQRLWPQLMSGLSSLWRSDEVFRIQIDPGLRSGPVPLQGIEAILLARVIGPASV